MYSLLCENCGIVKIIQIVFVGQGNLLSIVQCFEKTPRIVRGMQQTEQEAPIDTLLSFFAIRQHFFQYLGVK